MFRSIDDAAAAPELTLQVGLLSGVSQAVSAQAGDSVALALLKAGVLPLRRTAVSGQARAPLCLMGVCFDCVVTVNGRANVQACMVEVSDGMVVRLQGGARSIDAAAESNPPWPS